MMPITSSPASPIERLEKNLFVLTEVQRKHNEYIKTKYKISSLEMEIIQYIILNGKQKMKDIGTYFRVKLSTLTSTIDKIEKQKLVKRFNSKEDRRVVYLDVTSKGNKLYEDYHQYMSTVTQMMEKSMKKDQMKALATGLETMSRVTKI